VSFLNKNGSNNKEWLLVGYLLPETSRREQLCDDINCLTLVINPRIIKLHNISMLERLQKMNFCVEPIEIIWTLHHLIYVDLIPCNLNAFDLIKCLVTISI